MLVALPHTVQIMMPVALCKAMVIKVRKKFNVYMLPCPILEAGVVFGMKPSTGLVTKPTTFVTRSPMKINLSEL